MSQPRVVSTPYVSVAVPASNKESGKRRRTEKRLARNLAFLVGLDAVDNPSDTTWVCRYGDITVSELAKGVPREVDEAAADVIPTATLHRYGPETKAALILTAADQLFQSVETTMRDVLEVLGTSNDGRPLADAIRVTAWASLIADAYRAQPALFVAAIQARAVQRAAIAAWWPYVDPAPFDQDGTVQTFRSEYSTSRAEVLDPDYAPNQLGILDRLMHEVVMPRSPVTAQALENEGGGPSESFLTDSLIDRWIRHLVYSADQGLARVSSDARGSHIDAFLPHLAALSSFAADAQGHYPKVEAFQEGPIEDRSLEPYRSGEAEHVRRMLPRVPSLPEFAKLPLASQEALARTAVHIIRVLCDSNTFVSPVMLKESNPALSGWAELTAKVLGKDNPTTRFVELTWTRLSAGRARDGGDAETREEMRCRLLDAVASAAADNSHGHLSMGEWVEVVNDCSPAINAAWQDYAHAGRARESKLVRSLLADYWRSAWKGVAVDLQANPEELRQHPGGIAGLMHNYIGFQIRSPEVGERLAALKLGREIVLPARKKVADHRGTDTALRTSLQVILRGACITLPMLEKGKQRDAGLAESLLDDITVWTQQLARSSMVTDLMRRAGDVPNRAAHLNCLGALALGELTLAQRQRKGAGLQDTRVLGDHLDRAILAALTGNGVNHVDDLDADSERIAQLLMVIDGYRALTGEVVRTSR